MCTQDEVQGASVTNSICASGFWVTSRDENNANSGYGQGWYTGEDFADDCGGQTGLREWIPASGLGAAHCCVKCKQKLYSRNGHAHVKTLTSELFFTRNLPFFV